MLAARLSVVVLSCVVTRAHAPRATRHGARAATTPRAARKRPPYEQPVIALSRSEPSVTPSSLRRRHASPRTLCLSRRARSQRGSHREQSGAAPRVAAHVDAHKQCPELSQQIKAASLSQHHYTKPKPSSKKLALCKTLASRHFAVGIAKSGRLCTDLHLGLERRHKESRRNRSARY